MAFTESVRSFHVPATPGTFACPPSLPSLPTSRATRVTSAANERNCSTIVFSVSLSWRISPFTSTVILRDKSPRATAVVTSAMFRTWPVRLPAIEFTESVRSFHVPATPRHFRLPAEFAFRAHFAGHTSNFSRERVELVNHGVDGFFEQQNFAAHVDRDLLGKIAASDCRRYFGDVTHLAGQVAGHGVHGVGEILPSSTDAGHES